MLVWLFCLLFYKDLVGLPGSRGSCEKQPHSLSLAGGEGWTIAFFRFPRETFSFKFPLL
ncbi:hypothetical protein HMPREF1146_1877 [Prevotella sp. MSX73]|nr:hypothetical protein HMPREF1146_1877 [Prevotella sp. MSX73]